MPRGPSTSNLITTIIKSFGPFFFFPFDVFTVFRVTSIIIIKRDDDYYDDYNLLVYAKWRFLQKCAGLCAEEALWLFLDWTIFLFWGVGRETNEKNISRFKQIKAIKAFLVKNWPWRICKKSGKKRKKLFVSEQGGGLKRQILYAANRPYITIKILRMISNNGKWT